MGGRGASSGAKGGAGGNLKQAESIKQEMLQQGLNSKISGIRQKAEQGIGNYAFKNANAVSAETFDKVTSGMVFHERNGNTLVEGYLENGRHVFYANKSDSQEIQKLRSQQTVRKEKIAEAASYRPDRGNTTTKTTSTYESWRKGIHRKFDSFYGDEKVAELKKELNGKK